MYALLAIGRLNNSTSAYRLFACPVAFTGVERYWVLLCRQVMSQKMLFT